MCDLQQEGRRVAVSSREGRTDFELHLPWAKRIEQLDGGQVVALPDELPSGVLIRATHGRVAFAWE